MKVCKGQIDFLWGTADWNKPPKSACADKWTSEKVIRKDFQNEKMLQCADKWKSEKAIRKDFQSKLCQEIDFSWSPQIQECQESKLLPSNVKKITQKM